MLRNKNANSPIRLAILTQYLNRGTCGNLDLVAGAQVMFHYDQKN